MRNHFELIALYSNSNSIIDQSGKEAMGYDQQTLSENETVEYVAEFHWLYTATAILILILLGPFVIGIFVFFKMMIKKWTTEIVLTNDRFVFKKGWISRSTEEFALQRLEEVNLHQSILGRIFDYGKLTISGVGVGVIEIPAIDSPLEFRKALKELRSGGVVEPA